MQILSLSGWAQPINALQGVAPHATLFDYSEYATEEATMHVLARYRDIPMIIAWSMGAQLALKAIAAHVLKPKFLLILAAPFQFVSDAQFGDGMDPLTFQQFRDNYARDAARTTQRFHGLIVKGDKHSKHILSQLSHHENVRDTKRWLPWLERLGRESLSNVVIPYPARTIIVHGDKDAIVPVAQATHLQALMPKSQLEIWQDVAHAPHLHDAARMQSYLTME